MRTDKEIKKTCETCVYWGGTPTTYSGHCNNSGAYTSRVAFDFSCPLHRGAADPVPAPEQPYGQAVAQPQVMSSAQAASSTPIPAIGSFRPSSSRAKAQSPRRLDP